jgi:succinate dehydrogenase / fumarate reductase cytochrome b subunit
VPEAAPINRTAQRWFSLSGVLPLGAFLLVHAIANARALRGEEAFAAGVRLFDRIPALGLIEVLVVFVPLAVHAAIGLWLVIARAPLARPSPYAPGVRTAMRATGVLAIAFLGMHLPELRFRTPGARPGHGELLTALTSDLSSTWHGVPWRAVIYLAAAGCVAFHFAAGLWGVLATSWAGADERARRFRRGAAWGAAILGGSLWLLLTDVVVLHATGTRLIGEPAHLVEPASGECPPGPRATQ